MDIRRISFIEAGSPGLHVFSKFTIARVGTVLLSTILKEKGFEVKAFIEDIFEPDWAFIENSDLVCISTLTSTAIRAYEIGQRLKSKGIPGERKMTPKQKRILLVSGSVAVLLVVVVTVLVLFINVNVYKPRIEAAASDAIGMDFKIDGPMRIVFFPRFGVSLEKVIIKKKKIDFLSAETVRIGLRLFPLIRREVRISEFTIINPKINVERDKDGRFNFEGPIQKPVKTFCSMG
jgi:hypothetical protein